MAPGKQSSYIELRDPWQGVAIACRFRSSEIKIARALLEAADTEIAEIMDVLGGRHD